MEEATTGRKAKGIIKREMCIPFENTVMHRGLALKKVNTAIIDKKPTTYFKCKNMKTPIKLTGICYFSGRIVNYPESMEIEILQEHNYNCAYGKQEAVNNSITVEPTLVPDLFENSISPFGKEVIKNKNDNKKRQKSSKNKYSKVKKEVEDSTDIIRPYYDLDNNLMEPVNIYIQLWTPEDLKMDSECKIKMNNI